MSFPVNIPNVPGVPALDFSGVSSFIPLLFNDAISFAVRAFFPDQWGIFFGVIPVVLTENVLSFSYKKSNTVADYPIEQGKFESYDKVQIPFDARLRFSAGTNEFSRQALLDSLQAIIDDTNLYTVVTPDAVYQNLSVVNMDYQQQSNNGLGLLSVEVWLLEIREAPSTLMANVASPFSASQVKGGAVQPLAATQAQTAAISTINSGI